MKSGSVGSSAVTHYSASDGFWCINDEQPKDQECADFEVRFCCPEEYHGKIILSKKSGIYCAEIT